MCGIAGAIVFDNPAFRITEKYLVEIRDTMVHRGPDSGGVWVSNDKKVGLAHRRLSIIDLSESANQPMSNEDGSIWVVFNGEIYNHAEIRRELNQISSHSWKTDHSDTEVIVHSYEEWGIDCVKKFRGMFAIAIWDDRKKELFLIRDRIGIKPLYYTLRNGKLLFASEIKAILVDDDVSPSVDVKSLYHYLSFLTTPAPHTLFEGIKKLPPATYIKVDSNGGICEQRYWELWENVNYLGGADQIELERLILDSLREAVRYRKVSDVPVGVFLSGGIDSSTNAVLFSEGESRSVKTFSIGYEGNYKTYKNEFEYARVVAERINAEHYEKRLTVDDLIEFLPDLIYHQDEPIADPVCIPVYYVSKLARDNGVIVCQVGEGSDEIFCGYPWWMKMYKLYRLNSIPFLGLLKSALLAGLDVVGKRFNYYYELLRRGVLGEPIFWSGAEAFTEAEKKVLFSNDLRNRFANYSSFEAIKPIYSRFLELAPEKNPLNWMGYVDLNLRLPELLLMRVDKMSMAVSLEARVPFLDHKFVELVMSIPTSEKIKNSEPKYILKRSVEGLIPNELIYRKKQGFGVPVYEWFFDKLGERVDDVLGGFLRETNYFDQTYIDKLRAENNGWKLWYIFNFALWHRKWIEGK